MANKPVLGTCATSLVGVRRTPGLQLAQPHSRDQTALLLGSGSASFESMRALADRWPFTVPRRGGESLVLGRGVTADAPRPLAPLSPARRFTGHLPTAFCRFPGRP